VRLQPWGAGKVVAKKYSKVMVLPPSGVVRGEFESRIQLFEREFLKHGVTVIVGAVTGKVILAGAVDDRKDESASQLSDLERALIMAEKTGAEAVLQIGTFAWADELIPSRFFIQADKRAPFREVSEDVFLDFTSKNPFQPNSMQYPANELRFTGRVIDMGGEVVATLDMRLPANHMLPQDYHAKFGLQKNKWQVLQENYPYFQHTFLPPHTLLTTLSSGWAKRAQTAAEELLIESVVKRMLPHKQPHAPAQPPPVPPQKAEVPKPDAN